jgi:predicted Zn-dependent protease
LTPALALVEGKIAQAEALLRAHLRQYPTDVAALRMLAEVAARLGRNADAEVLLERCLELAPSFDPARHQYAMILHRRNKSAAALHQIDQLEKLDPHNSMYRNLKAIILVKIGGYRESIEIYAEVLKTHPEHPKIWASTSQLELQLNNEMGNLPKFTTFDFATGTGKNNWHLEAYIENLFDKQGQLGRINQCAFAYCYEHYRIYPIKPMNFGVKFGQKF